MKTFELLPTEENIINSLKADLLDRNKDLLLFLELIQSQEGTSSIAIDGRWGSGKTFFIKQLQLLLNANNPQSDFDDEERKSIKSIKSDSDISLNDSTIALYYDAWSNDNDIDPILSMIYQFVNQLNLSFEVDNNQSICQKAGAIMDVITGKNVKQLIESFKSNNPLDKINEQKNVTKEIADLFTEIIAERGNSLAVFVDELDRCKPTFAVKLLEQIKHYFIDDRITFVFAVNLEQLQHTIKCYYGNNFDACRYLDRFFDLRINLPSPNLDKYYYSLGLNEEDTLDIVCRTIIKKHNMELREITRFYRQVKTSVYKPLHIHQDYAFNIGKGRLFIMQFIVPLLCALRITDLDTYDAFVNGNNYEPLRDLLADERIEPYIINFLINSNESFEEEEGKKQVTKDDVVMRLYSAIFGDMYSINKYEIKCGQYAFNNKSKSFAIDASSMMTTNTDFDI